VGVGLDSWGGKGAGFDADIRVPQHLWDAPYGLWNCLLAWFAMGELESWWGIFLDCGGEQGGRRTSVVMGGGMEVSFRGPFGVWVHRVQPRILRGGWEIRVDVYHFGSEKTGSAVRFFVVVSFSPPGLGWLSG
jgi:hypothetical protein